MFLIIQMSIFKRDWIYKRLKKCIMYSNYSTRAYVKNVELPKNLVCQI